MQICEELKHLNDFFVAIDKKTGEILDIEQHPPFDFIKIQNIDDLYIFWKKLLKIDTEPVFIKIDDYIIERNHNDTHIFFTIKKSIHLNQFIEKLQEESLFDGLTECYTKKQLIEFIEKFIANFARYKTEKFSVLLFDIDFFKKINDTYGHLCGDVVLKELSKLIKSLLRSSDIISRFGGEEFVVILPNTKLTGALKLANRIRDAVEKYKFKCEKVKIPVTISIGVTSISLDDTYISLIKRVDDALYTAKKTGRNKVEYM